MRENEGLRDEFIALQAEKVELDTAMEEHTQQSTAHIRELNGELERESKIHVASQLQAACAL